MQLVLVILGYLKWHYGKALRSLTRVWGIFLSFILEYFSVQLLFRNFFDPWKKMTDSYPNSFDLKKYFYAAVTNLIVRIFGMIMRSALIILGLISCALFALLFPFVFLGWLVLSSGRIDSLSTRTRLTGIGT